jgi:hypothetical protein
MARTNVSLVLGLVFYSSANFLKAQNEINTDRPDLSSTVVPKGTLQLESGLAWASDSGLATVDGLETIVRLGITASGELRIALPELKVRGLVSQLLRVPEQVEMRKATIGSTYSITVRGSTVVGTSPIYFRIRHWQGHDFDRHRRQGRLGQTARVHLPECEK